MTDEVDYFKTGQKDCRAYYSKNNQSAMPLHIRAEDAIKIYWPNVNEALVQYVAPMPKPRVKWMQGFKKEQIIIKAEMEIKCLHCGNLLNKESSDG